MLGQTTRLISAALCAFVSTPILAGPGPGRTAPNVRRMTPASFSPSLMPPEGSSFLGKLSTHLLPRPLTVLWQSRSEFLAYVG